jgi:hypothetical protein
VVGIVEAGRDPEAKDIWSAVVGVIEGIDVGADGEAEGVGEVIGCVDGCDFGQMRLERGEPVGFDGRFVHVGAVEVGDLAFVGAGSGVGLCGIFDDAGGLFEAEIGEGVEDTESGAVGGEFCAGDKAAIGVGVEVIAGADGWIHVLDRDAVSERCCSGCGLRLHDAEGECEEEG